MNFASKLLELKQANLYREHNIFEGLQAPRTIINGREMLLFSSNSYLNLSQNTDITEKVIAAIRQYGCGAGGSRLTTGNSALHKELEARLAAYKGSEDCVVFSSGYMANVGTISALCGEKDIIFSDALNHASIIDGCRLSRAKTIIYAHKDVDDLRRKIAEARPKSGLIVTDGVFSMDGDIAPLPELAQTARDNNLLLMMDDAHGTGTLGQTGRGSLEHLSLTCNDVPVVMGTLSKAMASEGGFVCATKNICDYLRNTARSYIFSTALSPASVAAALGGLEYIQNYAKYANGASKVSKVNGLNGANLANCTGWENGATFINPVTKLQKNILYFRSQLHNNEIPTKSETAIQPIIIGDELKAMQASKYLYNMGIFVPCIRYPTVKKGEARLRFTLMAAHTHEDMNYAVMCLKQALGDSLV